MFRIYKNDKLVVEGESPLTITGIEPNTQVVEGTYQAVRVENEKESERVDIPAFKTLPIAVTGVTIAPKTNNLEVGATRQLNVTIEPSNATNQDVAYTSDNEAIATVDANGLVTAIAEGTAIITVTVDGKNDTATVNVTTPEPEPEVTTDEITEEIDVVEYETERIDTDELPLGEERVIQEGVDGYTTVTYLVTYRDGVEVDREETDREVTPPIKEVIEVGTGIITTDTITETENIVAHGTSEVETEQLPLGETEVDVEGVDGYDTVTYEVTYRDGVEIDREEVSRVTTEPIDEVILVGTYEEPEPEPDREPDPEPEE